MAAASAALDPIVGRDKILRLLAASMRKGRMAAAKSARPVEINGMPGLILVDKACTLQTVALDICDDKIVAVYWVANPDKLRHIG